MQVRLEEALLKRVQLIEDLLLIDNYAELVSLRVQDYRAQSQQLFEFERALLQTCCHMFRIDANFRKLLLTQLGSLFSRLNPRTARPNSKTPTMMTIHRYCLQYFKLAGEAEISKVLNSFELQQLSENEVFYRLMGQLLRYLKGKTDIVIAKLAARNRPHQTPLQDNNELIQLKKVDDSRQRASRIVRKTSNLSRYDRKHNSEGRQPKKNPLSERKQSQEVSKPPQLSFFTETKEDSQKGTSNIDWKGRLARFQEVFSSEWEKYYSMLPLEELEQLKIRARRWESQPKKEWAIDNYRFLYLEMLARNRPKAPPRRLSPESRTSFRPLRKGST